MKYIVSLSTHINHKNLKKGNGIIVIECDDYSDGEIKAIKKKGYTVLGYLSIGTIEKERSFYRRFKKYKKKRLADWPNEFYMDMCVKEWRDFLVNRARRLKERGCDGWWLDNLDVYEEYKSRKTFKACHKVLKRMKKLGGYVMVNGGSMWFDDAMDKKKKTYVDGVTQEEVFSLIKDYDGKGKFGKQTKEQGKWYRAYMRRLVKYGMGGFLLEYTRDDKLKSKIKLFCKKYGMSCCISEDVDL